MPDNVGRVALGMNGHGYYTVIHSDEKGAIAAQRMDEVIARLEKIEELLLKIATNATKSPAGLATEQIKGESKENQKDKQ